MSGSVPPLSHMRSWPIQKILYIYLHQFETEQVSVAVMFSAGILCAWYRLLFVLSQLLRVFLSITRPKLQLHRHIYHCTSQNFAMFMNIFDFYVISLLVPMAGRSRLWVCGRSPAEIVSSNPAGGMDVCML